MSAWRVGTVHRSGDRPRWLVLAAGTAALVLILAGAAMAYWSSSGAGSGQAVAGTAAAVILAPGTVTASLYPGGTADVATKVTNPNPYAVVLSGLSAGAITSGATGNSCDTNGNGVTFNAPSSYPSSIYRVPAKAGETGGPAAFAIDIASGASMAITSDTTCQGKTFTIPLTGTATATS